MMMIMTIMLGVIIMSVMTIMVGRGMILLGCNNEDYIYEEGLILIGL